VRLILGNDHRMFTDALAAALARLGVAVVATGYTPRAVVVEVGRHQPDVCMVAGRWSDAARIERLRLIRGNHPSVGVVVLSDGSTTSDVATAISIGAAAVVSQHQHVTDLLETLYRVRAGERPIDSAVAVPAIGRLSPDDFGGGRLLDSLTVREQEVLLLMSDGQATKEIARSLAITPHTARTHVQSVLVKLGVHSRLEASGMAARSGLLRPPGRFPISSVAREAAVSL
jgi:DNA-binding NarL/FixJ family response regulator